MFYFYSEGQERSYRLVKQEKAEKIGPVEKTVINGGRMGQQVKNVKTFYMNLVDNLQLIA